jgi:hypothetical protein
MGYIKPLEVISPKALWQLHEVLIDHGAGSGAYALGLWDDRPRIGFRWNGDDANRIGNPQSRGLPTWTMLHPELHEAVIQLLPPEKQDRVRSYLERGLRFEGVSLNDDHSSLLLWDLRKSPVIVAKIACSTIRELIGKPKLSNDDCRLVANVNIKILTEVAQVMFAQQRYSIRDNGVRIIEIGHAELRPVVPRLSLSVLQVSEMARWVG